MRHATDSRTGSGQWIPVDEAARVTGETVRNWRRRASLEASSARRSGREALARQASAQGPGRRTWLVHRSIDDRLAIPNAQGRADAARETLLARYPAHAVDKAYRKARWLLAWHRSCDVRQGQARTERDAAERIAVKARTIEGAGFAIGSRSLQLWRRQYYRLGRDGKILGVEGLIDRRGKANGDAARGGGGRSSDASDYFYTLFHTQSRHSVKTCHRATIAKAGREGWSWPASYSATRKWLQTHDNVSLSFLLRRGKDAWCRRFMPHIETDYTTIEAGAHYVCDHHQLDVWVEARGKQLRPWLCAIQDLRSRCIVGWHLGESPNQDTIVAAMRRAFRDWSIPRNMRIDNGKDFTSELITGVTKRTRDRLRSEYGPDWRRILKRDEALVDCVDPRWTGIVNELDIDLTYAIPYSPWSKGTLERWFGTFEGQCGKTFATYCGNSAMSKPECLDEIRRGYTRDQKRSLRRKHGKDWKRVAVLRFVDTSDVPTMEQARSAIGEYMNVYHHEPHSGLGGRSPIEVWSTAATLRRAVDDQLLMLMQSRGVYKVGGNGVAFKVGSERMAYGSGEPSLYAHRGRSVFVTLDPDDVSYCYAWTPDRDNRRLIGRLEANKRVPPNTSIDDLREALANIGRARKDMHQAKRSAARATRTAAQELTAMRRDRAGKLKATGTDGKPANIEVVHTAFDTASKPVRTPSERGTDRATRDLSEAAAALSYGFRPLGKDADADRGKDAGDLLKLIAGNRHGRTKET